MKLIAVTGLVFILCGQAGTADNEQVKKIPLEQIWAYNMPGTRKVGALDAVKTSTGVTLHPTVREIVRSLSLQRPRRPKDVGPAFIVMGNGKEALQNAHAVFTKAAKPTTTFSTDNELTLVFYSVLGAPYVHIISIELTERVITVNYQFVAHNTREDTLHFALIPLGQLPPGTYEVKIEQSELADARAAVPDNIADLIRVVCDDTSFSVQKEKPWAMKRGHH